MVCAGVGTVGLVDGDAVEGSNLHRQILHAPSRIGMSKVTSAALALKALAPSCNIVEHNQFLTSANARDLVRLYECILDCTDNAGACVSFACVSSTVFSPPAHHAPTIPPRRNAMPALGCLRIGTSAARQWQRSAMGGTDHCLQLRLRSLLPLHQSSSATCRGCRVLCR